MGCFVGFFCLFFVFATGCKYFALLRAAEVPAGGCRPPQATARRCAASARGSPPGERGAQAAGVHRKGRWDPQRHGSWHPQGTMPGRLRGERAAATQGTASWPGRHRRPRWRRAPPRELRFPAGSGAGRGRCRRALRGQAAERQLGLRRPGPLPRRGRAPPRLGDLSSLPFLSLPLPSSPLPCPALLSLGPVAAPRSASAGAPA